MFGFLHTWKALVPAGIATFLVCVIFIIHAYSHLKAYNAPKLQRYTLRIIFLVPIYAVDSFIALRFSEASFYTNTIRDMYEAYVIYNFVALCLAYMGGAAELVDRWRHDERVMPVNYIFCTCCLAKSRLNGNFLRRIMQGVLQFVFVKVFITTIVIITYVFGHYGEGELSPDQFYLYEVIAYNLSISIALYSLVVFYLASEPYLAPFRPLLKFVMVKSIIFVTWWQGLILTVLGKVKVLDHDDESHEHMKVSRITSLQDFLICLECLVAAIINYYAFSLKDYQGDHKGETDFWQSFHHAIQVSDVFADTANNFSPQYRDFVQMTDDNYDPTMFSRNKEFSDDEDKAGSRYGVQEDDDNDDGGAGVGGDVELVDYEVSQPQQLSMLHHSHGDGP